MRRLMFPLWAALIACAVAIGCDDDDDTGVIPTPDALAMDGSGSDALPQSDGGPTCQSTCEEEGLRSCQAGLPAVCDDANDDGCLEWTAEPACAAGLTCQDGACTATCGVTECTTAGARDCEGNATVICGDADANGCLEWSEPEACAAGQICSAGRCAIGCSDACNVVGALRCDDNATVVCDDHDGNGCLEWGEKTECDDGQVCSAGRCTAQCQNECSAQGARTCEPGGVKTCGDFDADGCLEWGNAVPCPEDQTCSNGACSDTCQNECAAGALRCELDDVVACGNYDGDDCLEWGTPAQCPGAQVCSDGVCTETCRDECPEEDRRQCNEAGSVVTCGRFDRDDCLEWGTPVACEGGQTCSGGACALACQNECDAANQWRCVAGTDNQRQVCGEHDGDGCLEWGSAVACGGALVCSGGQCAETCEDDCTEGAARCATLGLETCGDYNDDGCMEWGPTTPCGATETCTDGRCVARPLPQIAISELLYDSVSSPDVESFVELHAPAGTRLEGVSVTGINGNNGALYNTFALTGVVPADGLYVIAHTGASPALKAVADQLDDNVDFQNAPDSVQVRFGEQILDAVGYGAFGATDIFGGEGTPAPDAPAASSLARDAQYTDTNDNAADFVVATPPTPGLPNDAAPVCTTHTTKTCFEGNLWWVDSCGDREDQAEACQNGCQNAACVPCVDPCPTLGDVVCQNGALRTCTQVGACLQWGAGAPCTTGVCADQDSCQDIVDLVISENRELCGVHEVGRLVIQGGATVTCASGELEIHAREIFIDPASAIDLSAVSEEASGARYNFCADGHLNQASSGGGGGGNGTAGAASAPTRWQWEEWYCASGSQCYDEFCSDCAGSSGGAERDSAYNSALSKGGRGGDGCQDWTSSSPGSYYHVCDPTELPVRGGRGGGLIRLIASDRIDILGTIRAKGEDGRINATQPMSGSGGGAGGSVLLHAPTIEQAGTIDVSGGAGLARAANEGCGATSSGGGNGGNGRIKLLYSAALHRTGQEIGANISASYMPPKAFSVEVDGVDALRSPIVLSDSFNEILFSWEAPFAAAQGYWYRLDQSPVGQVGPNNGTYTATPSVRINRAAFTAPGTWYLHVITVYDPSGNSGTVSSAAVVHLSAAALSLTCESHPNQAAWTPGQVVMMRWAAPQGFTLEDFARFHYRVDRRSNTTYGDGTGWTTTTAANALIERDAAGAVLANSAYYIHVVGEDHFDHVGSAVAHYRVLIGQEPARGNFFGYVRDANGQPLVGVTLRLEPFALTQRTQAAGYFLFENMYLGNYTAIVEGAGGYERANITVNAAASPFTLTP